MCQKLVGKNRPVSKKNGNLVGKNRPVLEKNGNPVRKNRPVSTNIFRNRIDFAKKPPGFTPPSPHPPTPYPRIHTQATRRRQHQSPLQ